MTQPLSATTPVYEAKPSGQARAGVIVVQEAFGVNGHIKDVCRRFADVGYQAVAPHLFHRTGDPVISYDDIQSIGPHFAGLSVDGVREDLTASLDVLRAAGFGDKQIGIIGFCMGGTVTFFAAVEFALGAGVTFYGGGVAEGRFGMKSQLELAPSLQTPWLGLYGDLDQGIPVDDVEKLRIEVANAPVPTEIVRYPDANHGFHCDQRASYHEPSAKDAWRRTLEWFERYL